jgi:hypothetical protein
MCGSRALLLAAAAATVLITGCGQSGQPSPAGHTSAAETTPTAHAAPAGQTSPAATATCRPGWLAGYDVNGGGFYPGGHFYPDTPAGLQHAARDSYRQDVYNTGTDQGVTVTFTDTRGVTVNGFVVQVADSQGTIVGQTYINGLSGLPRFLAPGEAVSYVIDWEDYLGRMPTVTNSTYLHSSCIISFWN